MFLIRFIIGGLIIATVPLLGERLGGRLAGLLVVFPTLIILSFLAIGQHGGSALVKQASAGALWGLPALVVFLLAMYLLSSSSKQSYMLWILVSVACWIIAAMVAVKLEN